MWRRAGAASGGEEEEAAPTEEPLFTLPHPSYVYCVRAQPRSVATPRAPPPGSAAALARADGGGSGSLVLTGCNDHQLRLWDVSGSEGRLLSSKNNHAARINALAWPSEASVFTADGAGVIKQWEVIGRLGGPGGGAGAELKLVSSIEKKELRDVAINSLALHPNRRRLLVQTRKSQLLALDTRLQHFSTRYTGHSTGEFHVRATYSPDGRYVVAGSGDGRFYAWAEDSGARRPL